MRARRTDANLTEIVKAYRQLGCRVDVTNGKWDLTVQYGGLTDLVEVKDGSKSASRRKLTPAEQKTHDRLMIGLVINVEQVQTHVAAMRSKHFLFLRGYR